MRHASAKDHEVAAALATATSFRACVHLGCGGRDQVCDIPTIEQARVEAAALGTKHKRNAIIYANDVLGTIVR